MPTDQARGNERKPSKIGQNLIEKLDRVLASKGPVALSETLENLVVEWEEKVVAPTDNMGPTKHQPQYPSTMGGYDTLEAGLFGEWDPIRYEHLLSDLETAKLQAQDNQDAYIEFGGRTWKVLPNGYRSGVFYQYAMESGGVHLAMPRKVSDKYAAVRLRLGFDALIGRDMFGVFESVKVMLEDEGMRHTKNTISRVDMQVDYIGLNMAEIEMLRIAKHMVMRAKKFSIDGELGRTDSIRFGTDLQLCIYDKRRELVGGDPIKFMLMCEHRFGGLLQDDCTRFEFRARRDALREMEIDDINDLRNKEQDLIKFLTEWFRILEEPKKKGHTAEQKDHPIWTEVKRLFCESFNQSRKESICREWNKKNREVKCDAEQLVTQAIGCLATAMALQGEAYDPNEIANNVDGLLYDRMTDIVDRSMQRAYEIQVVRGIELLNQDGINRVLYQLANGHKFELAEDGEMWNQMSE